MAQKGSPRDSLHPEVVEVGADARLEEKDGSSERRRLRKTRGDGSDSVRRKYEDGAKSAGFAGLSGHSLSNKLRLGKLGSSLWSSKTLPGGHEANFGEATDPLSPDALLRRKRHSTADAEENPDNDRSLRASAEGQYARQTKDKTWQQIGRLESALEKPVTRRDIALLDKQFDRSIHASQREIRQTRKPGTGLMAEARMEQDIVAVKEHARKLVERPSFPAPSAKEGDGALRRGGSQVTPVQEDVWAEELQATVGVQLGAQSKQRDMEVQGMLAASLFEQKWADIVLGELQSQVLVSCLEQGKLLAKVRAQLATSFATLSEAQTVTLDEMHDMVRALEFYRAKAHELAQQQHTIRSEIEVEHEQELARRDAEARERYAAYEEEIKLVEASQMRMSDSLAALNGIYRKMRDDAETMRNLDMNDVCERLEKKLAKAQAELDELRPLRAECENLSRLAERQKDEIEDQGRQIEELREELEQRNGLVQNLMEQHSAHLSLEELDKERGATGVNRATDQNFEDDDDEVSDDDDEDSDEGDEDDDEEEEEDDDDDGAVTSGADAAEPLANVEEDGDKEQLPEVEDPEPEKKAKKKGKKGKKLKRGKSKRKKAKKKETPFIVGKKIRKATDTVQVPGIENAKLGGAGAAGEIREGMDDPSTAKTFLCPRCNVALDRAGNIDASALANSQSRLACEGYRMLLPNLMGYRPDRPRPWVLRCMRSIIRAKRCADFSAARMGKPKMRFPEFVYLWFTPRKERLEELESFEGQEAVLLAKAEADESRWALYYGIKKLAKELPEARVFYTFLDEKYGEDDFAFYLHCLTIMEAVVNERRAIFSWGFNTNACDYDAMREIEEEQGGEDEVDDFIFVEIRHAVEVTERVMKRASEDDCKRAVKTLVENAVQEEIRITPTTGQRIIDINVCLRVLLQEYRDEQAHRRAALRLMFGCASSGPEEQVVNKCVDLGQTISIVQSLNSRAGPAEAVTLYRLAHEMGRGKVNIESFTQAANRLNFFSGCLRLPSHFGTEAPNKLSPAQCVQIGTQVRQQMALLRPIVDMYMEQLDPPARRELQHLVYDVSDELERGGVLLDGRRALCAIRRLLFFLVGERNGRRELFGEQDRSGDIAVVNAKREVETLCAVLRDFAKDDREERMQELQYKSSALRIQQKWRQRQELAPGVPHTMRKLLSAGFEPGVIVEAPSHKALANSEASSSGSKEKTDAEAGASAMVRRRLLRAPALPEDFSVIFLEEAYKYKLCVDAALAVQSTLEEAIHGLAMSMFGVRAVAERLVYDFFYSVHQHAKSNLRLRLFARFTGVRTPALLPPKPKSALDPIEDLEKLRALEHEIGYGLENDWSHEPMQRIWPKALQSPDAAHTYVSALAAMHHAAGGAPGRLFVDSLPLPKAIMVVKSIFRDACNPSKHRPCGSQPSARVVEECMTRIERLPVQAGGVETDKLALIVLQGWHAENVYRTRSLSTAFEPREGLPESIVSLEEFSQTCAPMLLDMQAAAQPLQVVETYRKLCVESEPYEALQPGAIQTALHGRRECIWASRGPGSGAGGAGSNGKKDGPAGLLQTYAAAAESRWRLLVYYWQPLQATISETLLRLQAELPTKNLKRSTKKQRARMMQEEIDREDDEYARALERRRLLSVRLDEDLQAFTTSFKEVGAGGAELRNGATVEDAWALLRKFLEGLQLARYELGEAGEPIVDRWDKERLERMRPLETEIKKRASVVNVGGSGLP